MGDQDMRYSMLGLAAISATLLAVPAGAGETASPLYQVSMDIRDGGKLVASPSLRVAAGETATVVSDHGDGRRYSIKVKLSPAGGETVSLDSTIDVSLASGQHFSGQPRLTARLGERVSLRYGAEAGLMVEMVLAEAKRID
jgi:hypothetical protein